MTLAWRIRLALVALVAITCAVLTGVATTTLHGSNEERLRWLVQGDLSRDGEAVALAMAARPVATTIEELAPVFGTPAVPTQRVLFRIDDPDGPLSDQVPFVYLGHGQDQRVAEQAIGCALPPGGGGSVETPVEPNSTGSAVSDCEGAVVGVSWHGSDRRPGAPVGWLLVHILDRADAGDPVPELRDTLLLASGAALVITLLVAGWLAQMISRPLARARGMAEEVASGDLGVRLPVEGADEVAGMSAAVNTMADRLTAQIDDLERANRTQRRFVADVAHELRTPTAALLASAESLAHPQSRDEASALVIPQLRRLAGLTEDLLEISRMDAGRATVVPSRVDLVDLVREVVDEAGRPGDVRLSAPDELPVDLDAARARVVIRNLVANALQHGAPPVDVRVGEAVGEVFVSVTDAGPGVPDALRETLFDRFVRGDEARHGASTGLGLAIARENARLLGGSLDLGQDGRTFTLRLPAGVAHEGW